MFKYLIDQSLLQLMLDFISSSTSNMPTMQVIGLVDQIRGLRPLPEDVLRNENDPGKPFEELPVAKEDSQKEEAAE